MKKDQVKVGQVYSAKVSGSMAPVRIDRANPRGGWEATNLKTGKAVRIKSAQRLRGKAATWPSKPAEASAKAGGDGSPKARPGGATSAPAGDVATRANVGGPGGKRRGGKTAGKTAKPGGRLSGLDAAAKVLAEAGEPLDTRTMVERMLAKGLWTTAGKTPAATIYAAIIREIATKGKDARFRKTDRGRFELAG